MTRIIVAKDGTVYEAEHVRALSDQEVADMRNKLQAQLNDLNAGTAQVTDAPSAPVNQPVDQNVAAAQPVDANTAVQTDAAPVQAPAAPDVTPAPVVLQ